MLKNIFSTEYDMNSTDNIDIRTNFGLLPETSLGGVFQVVLCNYFTQFSVKITMEHVTIYKQCTTLSMMSKIHSFLGIDWKIL